MVRAGALLLFLIVSLSALVIPAALGQSESVALDTDSAAVESAWVGEWDGEYDAPPYYQASFLERASGLIASCGCCLFWLLIVLTAVFSASRGSWWGLWFWEMAVVHLVAERLGVLWARVSNRREMEREMRARTANPRDSKSRYNLGVLHMRQRRWDKAAEELGDSVSLNPDRSDAHFRLGVCLMELGRPEEAVASLHTCLEQRGDHYDAGLRLAEALIGLGRLDEARDVLDRFLARRRDDVPGWFWTGVLEEADGNRETAAERYRGVIERGRATHGPNRTRDRKLVNRARAALRRLAL